MRGGRCRGDVVEVVIVGATREAMVVVGHVRWWWWWSLTRRGVAVVVVDATWGVWGPCPCRRRGGRRRDVGGVVDVGVVDVAWGGRRVATWSSWARRGGRRRNVGGVVDVGVVDVAWA